MPLIRPRLFLVTMSLALAAVGLDAQQWAERGSRPRYYASVYPEAGAGGGAMLIRRGVIRAWDGLGWRPQASLQGAPVGIINDMAWDHGRNRTVGIGLDIAVFPYQPRTIELVDGVFQVFTAVPPVTPFALHYDPALGGVVAFTSSATATQDYLWNGSSWTPLPANVRPLAVQDLITADLQRSRLVALTTNSPGPGGQTYEWDGTSWIQLQPGSSPPARDAGTIAYDPATGLTTLYGGRSGTVALRDTWHWNGTNWFQVGGANVPQTSAAIELILDRVGGGLRLLDLAAHSVRDYRWSNNAWLPENMTPPAFADQLLGFDRARGVVTMLTGDLTHQWDGFTWSLAATSGPGQRSLTTLAFDGSRNEMVVFGGNRGVQRLDDTWTWNGVRWAQQFSASTPRARSLHAMFTSTAMNGVVMFGGMYNGIVPLDDMWLWSGGSWTDVTASFPLRPVGGYCAGASGRPGQTPLVVSSNELWSFNGSWSLLDSNVPLVSFQLLEMTPAGDAVLVANSTANRCYEFQNGAWRQRPGPDTEITDLTFDPVRGDVFGIGYGHEAIYSSPLATSTSVGQACTASRFALSVSGDPYVGNAGFKVNADGAQGLAVFGISFVPAQIPLGNGCYSYLGNPVVTGFVADNAYGIASLPLAVPLVTALRGVQLRVQAAGPQRGGPYGGLAVSAGIDLTIGG
ncbi:MAG: hypothetical protein KDC98_17365 [Planctomycetes bacterium]|nr:hypothetical protein [Planctomycetota bacterium]